MSKITQREKGIIYGGRRPEGWRLAHNHIRHTATMPHGLNGFRRFWIDPNNNELKHFRLCRCGWRPDLGPHYSRYPNARCVSENQK